MRAPAGCAAARPGQGCRLPLPRHAIVQYQSLRMTPICWLCAGSCSRLLPLLPSGSRRCCCWAAIGGGCQVSCQLCCVLSRPDQLNGTDQRFSARRSWLASARTWHAQGWGSPQPRPAVCKTLTGSHHRPPGPCTARDALTTLPARAPGAAASQVRTAASQHARSSLTSGLGLPAGRRGPPRLMLPLPPVPCREQVPRLAPSHSLAAAPSMVSHGSH